MTNLTSAAFVLSAALLVGGCKDNHSHKPGEGHSHDPKPAAAPATQPGAGTQPAAAAGDHPNRVVLGETAANGLTLKAMQDEPLKPGGEAAFDLVITGYPAGGKPKAVRFWVGTETGEGSAKAKAEEETPDHWHTHVEVPSPLPVGAKFWAEIEPGVGDRVRVSFDVKR